MCPIIFFLRRRSHCSALSSRHCWVCSLDESHLPAGTRFREGPTRAGGSGREGCDSRPSQWHEEDTHALRSLHTWNVQCGSFLRRREGRKSPSRYRAVATGPGQAWLCRGCVAKLWGTVQLVESCTFHFIFNLEWVRQDITHRKLKSIRGRKMA